MPQQLEVSVTKESSRGIRKIQAFIMQHVSEYKVNTEEEELTQTGLIPKDKTSQQTEEPTDGLTDSSSPV